MALLLTQSGHPLIHFQYNVGPVRCAFLMGANEAARVHHAYRWRHGNVAHEDVRATDGQASYYWISRCECFGLCSVGGCFCGPPARTRLGRGPARGPLLPQSGHTPLNVKAFECRISVRPVLGALALRTRLLSGWNQGRQYKKQCQRADSERRAANFLRVFLHNCLASFGVNASYLSLRSRSICEAVHIPCDWCREIDKNVMPVTPISDTLCPPSSPKADIGNVIASRVY